MHSNDDKEHKQETKGNIDLKKVKEPRQEILNHSMEAEEPREIKENQLDNKNGAEIKVLSNDDKRYKQGTKGKINLKKAKELRQEIKEDMNVNNKVKELKEKT